MTVLATCPHCEDLTDQKHIFTQPNQSYVETVDGRNLVLRSAQFVMVCESCKGIILYQTPELESDAPEAKTDDCDDEDEVYEEAILRLAFIDKNSECVPQIVWPPLRVGPRFEEPESRITLERSVPQAVRECYDLGTKVRRFSQDLYALQLRKVLEAICNNLGADGFLPSGKRAMLWQQIHQLGDNNTLSPLISNAAQELKTLSNTGAHYSELPVSAEQIRKLEALINLIVTYVYETKDNGSTAAGTIQVEDNVH